MCAGDPGPVIAVPTWRTEGRGVKTAPRRPALILPSIRARWGKRRLPVFLADEDSLIPIIAL